LRFTKIEGAGVGSVRPKLEGMKETSMLKRQLGEMGFQGKRRKKRAWLRRGFVLIKKKGVVLRKKTN